jgi:TPR repeat protein
MLSWTKAAAKQGYPVAQNNLGAMYMNGTCIKIDFKQAQRYFKLAADQGYITAQNNLMQTNTLLTGNPDAKLFTEMVKNIQQQMTQPVQ